MTRQQLRERMQSEFDSTANFTDLDYNDAINQGHQEILNFAGVNVKIDSFILTANKTYYDLVTEFSDLLAVIAIFNPDGNYWLTPTSIVKLDQTAEDWEVLTGFVEEFVPITYRYIAISRKPTTDGDTLGIVYIAKGNTLNSDSDVANIIEDHVKALESYVTSDLQSKLQEWTKATLAHKEYVKRMQDLKTAYKARINPDRIPQL